MMTIRVPFFATYCLALVCCLLPGLAAAEPFDCRSVDPRNAHNTLHDGRLVEGTNIVDAMCALADQEGIIGRDPCLTNPAARMKAAARFRCFAPGSDGGRRITTAPGSNRLPGGAPAPSGMTDANPMNPTAGELADCKAETESCRAACQVHRNHPDAFRYTRCMQPCEVQRASCQHDRMRARLKLD